MPHIHFKMTSLTFDSGTCVLVTAESWLEAEDPPGSPPEENCMLKAAARDLTEEELSGTE